MELVIDFKDTGSVTSLHSDEFPLEFLGEMKVQRNAELLYHTRRKYWYISVLGYTSDTFRDKQHNHHSTFPLNGFPSYSAARDFEVKWFNRCTLLGLVPGTTAGLTEAVALRHAEEAK